MYHVVVPVDVKKAIFFFHTKTAPVSVRSAGYPEQPAVFHNIEGGCDIGSISIHFVRLYLVDRNLHVNPPSNAIK
jgi:hypothetical protein